MVKRNLIILILILSTLLPLNAQVNKQETGLKREVTLYNPYKPVLPEATKRSFLPDMNDTTRVRPDFNYDVKTTPFLPEYTISPIKAASLLSDPLPRLYKSYIKLGAGIHYTPLAEISITNERSRKGAFGFYGRHFSTNGKLELDNLQKVFAGYMDNDASLFGKKFFRKSILEGSIDYNQKSRYAYGYNTSFTGYDPSKKDIRIPYSNIGGKASYSSVNLDSADFSYKFNGSFDYFTTYSDNYQRKLEVNGTMAKSFNGLYIGAGAGFDHYKMPGDLFEYSKYIASISPFVTKSSEQWSFKLGMEALLDRNLSKDATLHIYPDFDFSFNMIKSYVSFFAGLNGKLEKNEPLKIVSENPYLIMDGTLFQLPNTSHDLIISSGLKGNNGLGGNYVVSASYSFIDDMLFYSNVVSSDTVASPERGNHFNALTDDVELLNLHAEINGPINNTLSYSVAANYYKYNMYKFEYAWNKPDWEGKFGLQYNLRDKIIAGIDISLIGKRKMVVNGNDLLLPESPGLTVPPVVDMPIHFNLNLNAEYRYSKILSFWTKLNAISNNSYYEWIYYPTQGFMFMLGFTYSL
jgi:hypothetical protein